MEIVVSVFSATAAGLCVTMATRNAPLPGCGPGSACDRILSSRWSRWGPLRVLWLAAALYGGLAALGLLERTGAVAPGIASDSAATGALWVIGAALWFVFLQAVVVRGFCIQCTAIHAVGCFAAVLVLVRLGPVHGPLVGVYAVSGLALFVGGQLLLRPKLFRLERITEAPEPGTGCDAERAGVPPAALKPEAPADAPPAATSSPRPFAGRGSSCTAASRSCRSPAGRCWGRWTAPCLFAFFFDYTCTACRHMGRLMGAALDAYPGRFALVLIPVPTDPACNPGVTRLEPVHANACACPPVAGGLGTCSLGLREVQSRDDSRSAGALPGAGDDSRPPASGRSFCLRRSAPRP